MQRLTAQAFEVIWLLMGQAEFLWMIVTFVFTIIGALLAPAKAPADRNITARAADSVIVFRVLVIWCSPIWGSCVELGSNLGGRRGIHAEWAVHLAFMFGPCRTARSSVKGSRQLLESRRTRTRLTT